MASTITTGCRHASCLTMLGHTWVGESTVNLECVGFQTLLARGVQWCATGAVTIPIPVNFPGPDAVSLRKLS